MKKNEENNYLILFFDVDSQCFFTRKRQSHRERKLFQCTLAESFKRL
jgi:hypothetical protein